MHEEGYTSRVKRALREQRYLDFFGYVFMGSCSLVVISFIFIFSFIFKLLPKCEEHTKVMIIFLVVLAFCALNTATKTGNLTFNSWLKSFSMWLVCTILLGIVIGITVGLSKLRSNKILLSHCQKKLCRECGNKFEIKKSSKIRRWISSSGSSGFYLYCSECKKEFRFTFVPNREV